MLRIIKSEPELNQRSRRSPRGWTKGAAKLRMTALLSPLNCLSPDINK